MPHFVILYSFCVSKTIVAITFVISSLQWSIFTFQCFCIFLISCFTKRIFLYLLCVPSLCRILICIITMRLQRYLHNSTTLKVTWQHAVLILWELLTSVTSSHDYPLTLFSPNTYVCPPTGKTIYEIAEKTPQRFAFNMTIVLVPA
jgi:hypothetical protein